MNGPAAQRLPAPPQASQVLSRPKVTPTSSPAGRRTNLVRPSSVPLAAASQAPTGSPVMVRPSVSMADRTEAPPIVRDVLRSSGKPLDPGVRASMESSFGHDLSRVRIHDDKPAAASAQAVDAAAYTVGDHVVFGQGTFDSGSSHGRQLLGHELAHVLQQRNGAGLIAAGQPTARSESSADAAGLAAARGAAAGPVGATCVALARQPQPKKAIVMEPREATRVLLALPGFQFAADPSAGAMEVIAEVLEGPRTMENAVERRLRLRAACSVLDADSAAAVRMTLTRPATAKQRQLHESFGMLHHAIRAELLEILSTRASGATTRGPQGPAAAREPDLSKLPPTAEDLARTIRQLPASHSDQEVANFVARALRDLSPEDPATYQPVLAALADTRPAVFKVIAAWLARGRGASAARLQAQQEEQFKRDLELAQRSPGLLHMFIPGSMYTYRDLSSQIHNPFLRFTAHANIVEASREAHRRLIGYGEVAGILDALYLAAMVAPAVAEAAPAVSEAASNISLRVGVALTSSGATGARIIGTTLSLAAGALRAIQGSALQFYLSRPILVNDIGLFTVETVVSVDGDLPGLLKMLNEDPVQAAQFFLQVWVIHMSARTPAGDSYDVEIHARPLPIEEQTGPALRLKPVSVPTVTPVPEPSAAVGGPGKRTSTGGAGTGKSGSGVGVTREAAVTEQPTGTASHDVQARPADFTDAERAQLKEQNITDIRDKAAAKAQKAKADLAAKAAEATETQELETAQEDVRPLAIEASAGGGKTSRPGRIKSAFRTVQSGTVSGPSRSSAVTSAPPSSDGPVFQPGASPTPAAAVRTLRDAGLTDGEIIGFGGVDATRLTASSARRVVRLGKHFTPADLKTLGGYLERTGRVLSSEDADGLIANVPSGGMADAISTLERVEVRAAQTGALVDTGGAGARVTGPRRAPQPWPGPIPDQPWQMAEKQAGPVLEKQFGKGWQKAPKIQAPGEQNLGSTIPDWYNPDLDPPMTVEVKRLNLDEIGIEPKGRFRSAPSERSQKALDRAREQLARREWRLTRPTRHNVLFNITGQGVEDVLAVGGQLRALLQECHIEYDRVFVQDGNILTEIPEIPGE